MEQMVSKDHDRKKKKVERLNVLKSYNKQLVKKMKCLAQDQEKMAHLYTDNLYYKYYIG